MASPHGGAIFFSARRTRLVHESGEFDRLKTVTGGHVRILIGADHVQDAVHVGDAIGTAKPEIDRIGDAIGLAIEKVIPRAAAVPALERLTSNMIGNDRRK